jgi:hypothetical protein
VCVVRESLPKKSRTLDPGEHMCEQVARESRGIQPLGCTCECVPNDGGATVWVPTASRNSACARRDKINTMQSKERARCGRQRHLQESTGSARWPALRRRRVCAAARCGTAGNIQTVSSHGSVQPRLEGRVHNKVEGVEAHLALLDTTARRRCRGAAAKRTQSRGCRTGLGAVRVEAGEQHGEVEVGGSVR